MVGRGITEVLTMALKIELPAQRKGPRVRSSKEEVQRDVELLKQSQGTMHQWGRPAVLRLIKDAERLGVPIEVVES